MPALSVEALRKQYKSGKLAPIYLIVGDDAKLIETLVDGIEATIDDGRGADVGRRRLAERHRATGERSRARHDAHVIGIGDEQRLRSGLLENLGLGVRNRLDAERPLWR